MEEDYPGCRHVVREALKMKNVPDEAIIIMLSSLSDSSIKQYNSSLEKWWSFCRKNNVDPYKSDIPDILKFLTQEFQRNASHGTLNCCRSAIALLQGPEIGEDPRMKRFFKGITKLRPTKPKFESTWDPKLVLDHVSQWGPNEEIPLKKLTLKLVTLLALITGQRMQTLSLIDIKNVQRTERFMEIKIPDRIKTSSLNRKQPALVVPYYKEDKSICVASALETYLSRTKQLRNTVTRLFIATKKPYNAVSSQTLSRWIKNTLDTSGVDKNIFDAYSTRHASTSAAKRNGVNIEAIKKAARWTNSSRTFARFYDRDIVNDRSLYAKSILDSRT